MKRYKGVDYRLQAGRYFAYTQQGQAEGSHFATLQEFKNWVDEKMGGTNVL